MSKLFRQLKDAALRRSARKENLLTDALKRAEEARNGQNALPAPQPPPGAQRMLVKDPAPPTPELAELQRRFGFNADDDEAREAQRQRRDAEAVAMAAARAFAERAQREKEARETESTIYRARERLDPRKRVTLSRGTVAAWVVATALLAIWEIASWREPRPPGQPAFVRLFAKADAPEPQRTAAEPPALKLDYALDLTRTGGAARSSPRGPAPSR